MIKRYFRPWRHVAGAGTRRALRPLVLRRYLLPFLVVFACVSTIAAVADALVVTEAERLHALADSLSEEEPGRRVDQLLRYVAPDREAVEVTVSGRRGYYAEGDEVELSDSLRDGLAFIERGAVESVQQSVTSEGDTAVVALRLRAGAELHDVTLYLRRHDDRWLARRVVIR